MINMEKSNGNFKGWKGICKNAGKFVPAEDGFAYVCAQVGIMDFDHNAPDATEFAYMLVEWYFSGNWIAVYEGEDDV